MNTQRPSDAKVSDTATAQAPVVVDLGKRGRKAIRRLREGNGKLLDEVIDVVDRLRQDGAVRDNAQLVVVVVRQRRSKAESDAGWPLRC